MKRKITVLLSIMLILSLFLAGCLNYKAYDVPEDDQVDEEQNLINEIAEIEKQLEDNDLIEDDTNLEVTDESVEEETSQEDEVEVVEEDIVIEDLEEDKEAELITIEADESELVSLNVEVTDPDGDEVSWKFSAPLNDEGEWQTNYGDAGQYYVTLTATDGVHETEQEILLIINRVNVAPVIEELDDLYFDEGDEIVFEPEVNDPNGDAVTVTVSEPLASGLFSTDHTSAGEYEITVVASDGELETEKSFMLIIDDVNELPVISNFEDIEVSEGDTVVIDAQVSDLDGDDLEISISDPVGDDGVWETTYTDHGEYEITITVDDGKDVVSDTISLTVEDVNMPPEIVDVSLDLN